MLLVQRVARDLVLFALQVERHFGQQVVIFFAVQIACHGVLPIDIAVKVLVKDFMESVKLLFRHQDVRRAAVHDTSWSPPSPIDVCVLDKVLLAEVDFLERDGPEVLTRVIQPCNVFHGELVRIVSAKRDVTLVVVASESQ